MISGFGPRDMQGLLPGEARHNGGLPDGGGAGVSVRVLAFAEGVVGDAPDQPGVMLEGTDIAPGERVGVGVEMIVAERLQAGEQRVDLGLARDEGGLRGVVVTLRLLGAQLVAGWCLGASWRGSVAELHRLRANTIARPRRSS